MIMGAEDQELRELAASKHDREAGAFEKEYGSLALSGYRSTALLVGRSRIDRCLTGYLASISAGSRILDAGCGTGHEVAALVDAGFDTVRSARA